MGTGASGVAKDCKHKGTGNPNNLIREMEPLTWLLPGLSQDSNVHTMVWLWNPSNGSIGEALPGSPPRVRVLLLTGVGDTLWDMWELYFGIVQGLLWTFRVGTKGGKREGSKRFGKNKGILWFYECRDKRGQSVTCEQGMVSTGVCLSPCCAWPVQSLLSSHQTPFIAVSLGGSNWRRNV